MAEARSRGRTIGDDAFLLVATDMGLIFCRPSISFALAARWEEISIIRPRGDDPVVLPITWPRHGELKFTVSKRLAGNIFRRWLQLRMMAARHAREAAVSGRHRVVRVPTGPVDLVGRSTGDAEGTGAGPGDGAAASDGVDLDEVLATGPPTGSVAPTAAAATGDAAPVGVATENLVDEELERVAIPQSDTLPPAWVGSVVSMVAAVFALSTIVLIASVSVGLMRDAVGDDGESVDVAATGGTVVDHERFRPVAAAADGGQPEVAGPITSPAASAADDDADGPATEAAEGATAPTDGPGTTGLAASAPGGASQAEDPSRQQQLLALPPEADPEQATRCDSNYSGCVPDVDGLPGGDVDCAGQGDGPWYVDEEVVVLGVDRYELDPDGDGFACTPVLQPASPVEGEPIP
ncbi:MAG: hypothetical protein AAGA93_06500 [Actinomycetota bacterium]